MEQLFNKGRVVFAVVFSIVFIGVLVWAYRSDLSYLRRHYRGLWWIALSVIGCLLAFVGLKRLVL
ncbi:MAG: hypothetical protein N2110_04015 [Flavobacteriales bacterium]|nr:hypothetical protein [Flavobacteriales bacterium]MCX7768176.1 hypothetical protein [Flavobacteriales bacterium]MDW8409128.1 hypothetical protein [Flavobacteriales bacterium]